jgi:import inner membrane translocase subunit TIM44
MLHLTRRSIQKSLPQLSRSNAAPICRTSVNQQHCVPKCCSSQPTELYRTFSTESGTTEKKKDLRESIEKLKSDNAKESKEEEPQTEVDPRLERLSSMTTSFIDSLSQTWRDLISAGAPKDINKKIGTPVVDTDSPNYGNDDEAADKYEEYKGSKDIMLIDPQEHLSAWERMERRLKDAPIIQDILERSSEIYEKSGAQEKVNKARQNLNHLKEDATEAWETSQNPWVYRASSVYDTLTAESEFAAASRQLQKLDPDFTMENWKRDVVEYTLPNIMKLFLEGRIQELKPWLGEAVYNRLAAEVRARKKDGVQMDTNVLAIMNAEILACEVEGSSVNVEKGDDPIILLHFMCQQIHCVRKKGAKDNEKKENKFSSDSKEEEERTYLDEELGDIVEGSEDDIRANSYVVAFQREYNEEKMELNWKIVDFRFNGAIAYL